MGCPLANIYSAFIQARSFSSFLNRTSGDPVDNRGIGCLSFFVSRRLKRPSSGRVIRYLLAFLLLASQISYHIWRLYYGTWSVRTSLPLELSDLSVYLCAAMLLTRNKKMFSFLIFAGLGSSLQAMLTPNLGMYSFPHFRYLIFFMSHGSVFYLVYLWPLLKIGN